MNKKYQNAFFIFGVIVLAVMLTQLDFAKVWEGVRHAGYWFGAVLVLWAFLYMLNTAAWYLIINNVGNEHQVCRRNGIGFWWLYKITVSAFALNSATPGGLMGGEPYRIMSLSPKIGTQKASSTVILYVMTHIYSHFWVWLSAVPLYLVTEVVTPLTWVVLPLITMVCLVAIWFFSRGYRKGIAMTFMNVLSHVPLLKRWAQPFIMRNREKLDTLDSQIAALHNQNPRTFVAAVMLEYVCRIFAALEIYFVLLVIMPDVTFTRCILIYAFTSLFANMLFFMPLQLGGREGGFLMSTEGLSMTASAGIFVAILARVRELIWTTIGLLLIKFDKKAA
jgi:uncharacterized membrane protein YbhN (UPF0104 family)